MDLNSILQGISKQLRRLSAKRKKALNKNPDIDPTRLQKEIGLVKADIALCRKQLEAYYSSSKK